MDEHAIPAERTEGRSVAVGSGRVQLGLKLATATVVATVVLWALPVVRSVR